MTSWHYGEDSYLNYITAGPSNQTDVVVSADGLNDRIVEFSAGDSAPNSIPIDFDITDDEIGLEAVERYNASFTIIFSEGIVIPGIPETTTINVLDDDGT